jgi:hypothetical protein
MFCSTQSIARPASRNWESVPKRRSTRAGASPTDGSSSSRRRGSHIITIAMPSIRRSPPDRVSARWVRRSQILGNSSLLLAMARSAIWPEAALERAMSRFSRTVRLPKT